MRPVTLPISGLEYAFRANVCDRCPHRTPVTGANGQRACQANCGQYRALPYLYDVARRMDPMVGNVSEALKDRMPIGGPGVNWARGRRQKVIQLIKRYVNH